MFLPDGSVVGLLPVSQGHVSTDYEVTSAANGCTMILTRETRACNPLAGHTGPSGRRG